MKTLDKYREILRNDFAGFIGRTFRELKAAENFTFNWHIDAIAEKLEEVRHGENKRLIINLPPRQGKSVIGSVAFPAFLLGHNPAAKILCVSYAQDLTEDLADQCRTLMNTSFYKALFSTRLRERQAVDEYHTTAGGYRLSKSLAGSITGRGADVLIIDDPIKADDAQSEAKRQSSNLSFYNSLYSRLNNKESGAIVIIMQRLHVDDFTGFVQQNEPWDVLKLPAIAEKKEVYSIRTPYGTRPVEREKGEVLHPERESSAAIEKTRVATSEYIFSAQYQQEPRPPAGLIVKSEWLSYYNAAELPQGGQIIQSWDTANKDTDTSNFSVCTTWRYKTRNFWLLDVYRGRVNYPQLKSKAADLARLFNADTIIVEDKASGIQLIQELPEAGFAVVAAPASSESKSLRLANQTAKFESGLVHLPQKAHWLEGFVAELTGFPNTQYDDQVDSVVHALAWDTEQQSAAGMNVFRFYEQEAGKRAGKASSEEDMMLVRVRTSGQFYGQDGQLINLAEGDELSLSFKDAGRLIGLRMVERIVP